jgi:two-component system KDP operon response regulator KdpE
MMNGAIATSMASLPQETVLVVEDEVRMRRFLWEVLSDRFRVAEASSLAQAERMAAEKHPVAVLLDLMLPDGDGIDLIRMLRERSRVPVIVLSGRDGEGDKVAALDAGAVDYLTKPFGAEELRARLRVALRHARELPAQGPRLRAGPISIDRDRREVTVDGRLVHLTPTELDLLTVLARQAGKVVLHDQLLSEVWGAEAAQKTQYLRVHMMALRRKLELEPARPRWLVTEAGVGYRLRDQ